MDDRSTAGGDGVPARRPSEDDLRAFPFLADLAEADSAALRAESEVRDVPAGTQLIAEGEADDRLFLLLSGSLSVVVDGEHRARLLPPDVVGEIAATPVGHSFRRTASVNVEMDAVLIAVPGAAMKLLEQRNPAVREHVRSLRARRLSFDALSRHLRP
jgi:CRP-like cAMP-binding protein